jgi:regulator of protease activity HflC (stomatin/prohibitin superfamily)
MIIDVVGLILSIGTSFGFILIVAFFLASAIKVVPEYQRVVVFRLGRLVGSKGGIRSHSHS